MFQRNLVDKIKTHVLCSITFFRISCRLLDNVEKYGRATEATGDNTIRRMRLAYWITKATDTQSAYVVFIAFRRQQRLRERASMSRLHVSFLSFYCLSTNVVCSIFMLSVLSACVIQCRAFRYLNCLTESKKTSVKLWRYRPSQRPAFNFLYSAITTWWMCKLRDGEVLSKLERHSLFLDPSICVT
jgi:hypothetical protein